MWSGLLKNNSEILDVLRSVHEKTILIGNPSLGGEDFGYFLELIPGCMFSLGTSNKESGIITHLHSDTFNIDNDALIVGVDVMYKFINELVK